MKATQATIRQRVEELLEIVLDGAQFVHVCQYVAEKQAAGEAPWTIPEGGQPLSQRTIWRYLRRAYRLMEKSYEKGRGKLRRRHLAQRRHLYAKAVSMGDIRAALACARDEALLEGLYDGAGGGNLPAAGNLEGAIALLSEIIQQTGRGSLDTRKASTVGSLVSVLLRALEGGELARQLAELKEQLEEMRRHESGHDPKRIEQAPPASAEPPESTPAGEASERPGAALDRGEAEPGPLAAGSAANVLDQSLTPLWAADG
jgi:hypothetical protein